MLPKATDLLSGILAVVYALILIEMGQEKISLTFYTSSNGNITRPTYNKLDSIFLPKNAISTLLTLT